MLKKDCEEKYNGRWLDFNLTDYDFSINELLDKKYKINKDFYLKTGTNEMWLGCVKKE